MQYICRKLTPVDLDMVMQMNEDYRAGFICRDNAFLFLQKPENWLYAAILEHRIIGFAYDMS